MLIDFEAFLIFVVKRYVSSGLSIFLGLLLGKLSIRELFFLGGKIGETGMESEGQEKC